ncbi:beta ketoacyl-acyl carrier protein synthase [Chondrocystis sp. NIES-4102]|nr:beta ketoacyl-acyl carrier protein synthase [Chondrocystis sp. NIES-4102]
MNPNLINHKANGLDNNDPDNDQSIVKLLSFYFQQRGAFLAQVIKADLTSSNYGKQLNQSAVSLLPTFPQVQKYKPSNGNGYSNGNGKVTIEPKPEPIIAPNTKNKNDHDVQTLLINLIVEQTGYPKDTISGELRLLDDLNLDSIKAGELIATAAQKLGVAGKLEPSSLANATIKEITKAIASELVDPKVEVNSNSPAAIDVTQLLLDLVATQTGFPLASLDADLKLLDDLNLDSIKAGELVATAAQKLGVGGQVEPASLANATIKEIAQVLELLNLPNNKKDQPLNKPVVIAESTTNWVRNFKLEYINQAKNNVEVENWSIAKVLIVCQSPNNSLVSSLKTQLQEQQAQVLVVTYQDLKGELTGYTHYFAFLPEVAEDDSNLSLESMTTRLKSIATAPKNSCITYIQFGGGKFGTNAQNIHPEVCNAAAFARSVHLERNDLKVRVIDLDPQIKPDQASQLILQEIPGTETIVTVGYDLDLNRWLPQSQIVQPVEYQPRKHNWTAEDVILVTGGAKGITAECALALAQETQVKMALVGRGKDITGEIAQTLERFEQQGLTCRYYGCDVADGLAVEQLVATVNAELGNITGIIHGAGLNTPRRVEQVTLEAAQKEASPKLLGAYNLLQALKQPIKIFTAFSSIIGVTGMAGNSWYAFANESLALLLNRWQQQHPESDVISLAYSVWSEVGMGARLGSIKHLARLGIEAIPPQAGIERFIGLFKGDPGVGQIIIAARLGGLDTWHPQNISLNKPLRFIEQVEYIEPGVETKIIADLNIKRDRYIGDHIWRGSYLFPTVFGLEAMAQATAYVLGDAQPQIVRIENISLRRPVVVNPQTGTKIQIHAEVLELDAAGEIKVKVGISSQQSNYTADCFSAELIVGKRSQQTQRSLVEIGSALDIQPQQDLYGGLLFQGELFQRLEKIYSLSRELSILSVTTRPATELTNEGFGEGLGGHLILGDAYYRDVLLQCMQVNIPQDICLPVQIDCIQFNYDPSYECGERILQAILHKLEGREYLCEVIATDKKGIIRERIQGYRLRILEEHPENPTAQQLANPESRDRALLHSAITKAYEQFALIPNTVELAYLPKIGYKDKKQRRQLEKPLITAALAQHLQVPTAINYRLKTLANGKPQITVQDYPEIDLSLSHDQQYCLCTVGMGAQGCDIEIQSDRSATDWLALLSNKHSSIVEELITQGDDRNCAGTRIWSATEAVRKAFNGTNPKFSLVKHQGTTALLKAETEIGRHLVLTLSLQFTRPSKRVVALVVQPQGKDDLNLASATIEQMVDTIIQPHHHRVEITNDGPQGQRVYLQRFQVSFRQACSISRNVPVSQYIGWVGKFREIPMISMAQPMLRDFYSGQYGMVTNDVTLRILGDVTTYDTIQGRCWLGNLKNSSFDTYIEFCKVLADHSLVRVAMAEVKATWVKLLKYGVPAPEALPDYLANYLSLFTVDQPASIDLKNAPTISLPKLPEPNASLDPGEVLYQATPSPKRQDLLFSKSYQTTLEEANAVGNVYYGNYFIWQGRTLDFFFYQFIPEYFRVEQAKGEVLSVYSRMTYLKEAMPFDTILTNLYVDEVTECGAEFTFQFFRQTANGELEKLHSGVQKVVWATRQTDGRAIASPWPQPVLKALLQAARSPEVTYALAR